MKHTLFLFDLDDTLLDFQASERISFDRTLRDLGYDGQLDSLFGQYQGINQALWRAFEAGTVTKDFIRVERFRQTFAAGRLELDPERASERYFESLTENVVLVDGAQRVCQHLAAIGEIGIITNGVAQLQARRIAASGLGSYISFVATSEACGFAKPDSRFFDYTVNMARGFARDTTVIVGDRLDADILGANRFGIESCWYNPGRSANQTEAVPTYDVGHLDEVVPSLSGTAASSR